MTSEQNIFILQTNQIQSFFNTHFKFIYQRTNGPVNAHLIAGPTVSAKTSKIGQSQPRVIIYIYFVDLESPILHAKFQDHRTSSSGEELVSEKMFENKGYIHVYSPRLLVLEKNWFQRRCLKIKVIYM